MIVRRLSVIAAIVGGALLLSGCDGAPEPAKTTPLFSSVDEAFAAAEQTYRDYVDALNQVDLSDPETFEPVFALTTGELNANERKTLSQMHADGWTVSGVSKIKLLEATSFDGASGETSLVACLDVSAVGVSDQNGKSTVDPDRVDVQKLTITTVRSGATTSGMILNEIQGREGEPEC